MAMYFLQRLVNRKLRGTKSCPATTRLTTGSLRPLGVFHFVPVPALAQVVDDEDNDYDECRGEDRQRDDRVVVGERQDHLLPPCWNPSPRICSRRRRGAGRIPTESRCSAQARRASSESVIPATVV